MLRQLKLTPSHVLSWDQALDEPNLSPGTRKKCLKLEYRTCGRHALLPGPLKIPVHYDRTVPPLYSGGFADVWKGEHRGQDVAVKVLRTTLSSDTQRIIGVSCRLRSLSAYLRIDTTLFSEVLQGGCNMESPPASEYPTVDWSCDVGNSVRNGVRMDGEWEH